MINWQQIKQLEEDVGLEDLADVVVLFLSEVDEAIDELPNKDFTSPSTVAEALHFPPNGLKPPTLVGNNIYLRRRRSID